MTDAAPTAPEAPPAAALRFYLAVGLGVFLACLFVTAGHLQSPDDELLFRQTESLALRGSLAVQPIETDEATGRLLVPENATFATVKGRDGLFYVQYLPLQSLLAVPLVWVAEATAPLLAEPFSRTLAHGRGHYTVPGDAAATWRRALVVMLFNPLITALTAMVMLRLVQFLTRGNRRAALGAVLLYVGGTMALTHSRSFFSEPLPTLATLLAIDQLLRWYMTPLRLETRSVRLRRMLFAGLALAAAIWTRMDSPLIAFGFGITLVLAGEWKRWCENAYGVSRGPWPFADYAVTGALVVGAFAALVAYNAWRFAGAASLLGGGYSDQPEAVEFSTPLLVGLHGYLFSPGRGMFFFSPALLLGVWGWLRVPTHLKWARWIMVGVWLPFALFQVKWQNWDGGWCWGPRHIYQLHAPIMIGAAFLFTGCESLARRVAIKVLGILGLLVQLYGSTQTPIDFYNEFFRSPEDGMGFSVAYRPAEYGTVLQHFSISVRDPQTGRPAREVLPVLPAPMVDSLYLPHHTQWAGYARMLRDGQCDWWLMRPLFARTEGEAEVSHFGAP